MFCTSCGTHLSDDARFCTACGRPTSSTELVFEAPRRLYRIPSKKKIAGVCAGFAEYFGMDVTLVRIIWVALLIMPPSIGAIAYILSWFILPVE